MKDDDREKALSSTVPGKPAVDPSLPPGVVKRITSPSRIGFLPAPDGYAYLRGDCGDSLEVFLSIREGRVHRALFDTLGCSFTLACGETAMDLLEGKTLKEAMQVGPDQISDALGGLPASHFHCAELAYETVRLSLEDYLSRRKDPWKKLYKNR